MKRIDEENFLNEVKRCIQEQDGLCSISGMANRMAARPEYADLNEGQIYRRFRLAGLRLFGRMVGRTSNGPAGSREYEWAVKLGESNYYRHLTEEEKQKFDDYTIDWRNSMSASDIQAMMLLDDQEKSEELRNNFFANVIGRFKQSTGLWIARATKY